MNLDVRMKEYEYTSRIKLLKKTPVIIRIDGKAFHTFTRGFNKPFDDIMVQSMIETTKFLCKNIQGAKIAYTQSDEISILLTDFETIETDTWFDNNVQKIASVAASMATYAFNKNFEVLINKAKDRTPYLGKYALFDARVFNLPKEEVINYFIWRQKDASKNSVSMVARAHFSHKQCDNKNTSELQELLFSEKNINWNNLPVIQKRGTCIVKTKVQKEHDGQEFMRSMWVEDLNIPIFTQNHNYINKYVFS